MSLKRGIIKETPMRNGFVGFAILALAAALIVGVGLYVGTRLEKPLGTSFTPVQAGKTTLSGAGVTAVATTVNLTSLLLTDGITPISMQNFGSIGFATIEPGVPKKEENISFTGITQNANGTAQLTGVTRGLLPVYPYTASTTLAIAHSGGVTLILSNSAPFYNQFAIANNTTTVQANWTYNSSTLPKVSADTTDAQVSSATNTLATVNYVNSVASSGAANANTGVNGISQLATTAQISSGTVVGSTGGNLVARALDFGASSTARIMVPVTGALGTLVSSFIDQSASAVYNFLGQTRLASTTITNLSISATTTLNANLVGAQYIPLLASSVVSSTQDFVTTSTSFVTIGTSTIGGIASTTMTLQGTHRVLLTFTGTVTQSTANASAFNFSVDGAKVTGAQYGISETNVNAAGLDIPTAFSYITDSLSAGSHTFRAMVLTTSGSSTVLGASPIWQFAATEMYN